MTMKRIARTLLVLPLLTLALSSCALVSSTNTTRQTSAPHSITVQGVGMVQAQPDVAQINLSIAHTAPTTQEARGVVASTVRSILSHLQSLGVEERHVQTQYISYHTEYDYRESKRILLGMRAHQSLSIRLVDIITQPERLSAILDKVSTLERVELDGVYFDIQQKEELYRQSRELAYNKAKSKAEQYARLSGKRLGAVLTLSEERNDDTAQSQKMGRTYAAEAMMMTAHPVPTGEQSVTTEVTIAFAID